MEPLVSIVIPAYCHEKYIDDCLDSIIGQTYQNIELIIIDDCSIDNTYKKILCRRHELEYRFCRVVIQQNEVNLGVVVTENRLLALCRGKYIKSIGSDDMILENGIELLVDYYEQHQEYDFIFSNELLCSEKEKFPIIDIRQYQRAYLSIPDLGGNIMQKLYEDDFIQAPTVLFKKATFEKYGIYDETLTIEDWEYWLRVAERGRIGYCDQCTVAYRVSGNSLSHFETDEEGRKRLRKMYYNQSRILKKYEKSPRICAYEGYKQFYEKMLQKAIDIGERELQREIIDSILEKRIFINLETCLKYICYKLHVLKIIQRIKRLLGMETADSYKVE